MNQQDDSPRHPSRLGEFEILHEIGRGGMGIVYAAVDSKLDRQVAIKVLPQSLATDHDRLDRFRREARALASLNHSGIAAIHNLDEVDGIHFLVLELVDGETLRERLIRGPLEVEEALQIASDVATAVEAAHASGVIHRDLKPENIKLTSNGQVKLLDFGLAKCFEPPSVELDPVGSPTVTHAGMILGTAAYMSPEQARGKTVDKRTDIWSLGSVLFETLSGHQAFCGDSISDTLASVIADEPDWAALPPHTPPEVFRVLRRCLAKDVRRRLHDVADVRLEVEEALSGTRGVASGTDFVPTESASAGARRRSAGPMLAVGVLCLLLGAAVSWLMFSGTKGQAPLEAGAGAPTAQHFTRRTMINLGPGESWPELTIPPLLALSSDGKELVYVALKEGANQVFRRPLSRLISTAISGGEGADGIYLSPGSRWLALRQTPGVFRLPFGGGKAELVARTAVIRAGLAWDGDQAIYYATGLESGVNRTAISGGDSEVVTTLDETDAGHIWPTLLPDGKHLLFASLPSSGLGEGVARLHALDLQTGRKTVILEGAMYSRYLPTGHLIYTTWPDGPRLMAVLFDPESLKIQGTPIPILPDVLINPNSRAPQLTVSSDGTLVYLPEAESGQRTLVWVGRDGSEESIPLPAQTFATPRISPNGDFVITSVTRDQNRDIWKYDLMRGTLTRTTTHPATDESAIWDSEGTRIYFTSQRAGFFDIFAQSAETSGEAVRVTQDVEFQWPRQIGRDGDVLLFHTLQAETSHDIGLASIDKDRLPELLLEGPYSEFDPSLSPDGRWIAYTSDETDRYEIFVRSFPGLAEKHQVSSNGGMAPLFGPKGDELFFVRENKMFHVSIQTDPSFSIGEPELLFEGPYVLNSRANAEGRQYDISPRDGRFLILKRHSSSDTPPVRRPLVHVENWFDELRRQVPTAPVR